MNLQFGLRFCYRQIVANRYILISILTVALVCLLSWSDDEIVYKALKERRPDDNPEKGETVVKKRQSDDNENIGVRVEIHLEQRKHDLNLNEKDFINKRQPDTDKDVSVSKRIDQTKLGNIVVETSLNKKRQDEDTIVETSLNKKRQDEDTIVVKPLDRVSPTPVCPKNGQPSQIILLTYGRSGSSLTGDILQQHPDVYFHYEPLHNLAKTFSRQQGSYKKTHGKRLYLTGIPYYNSEAERVIELLLTCNFTHLPPAAYRNNHLVRSQNTLPLIHCIRNSNNTATSIHHCLKINSESCRQKPTTLIKTIRMTVKSVGHLMARQPNLKVIYLMRDPRGSYVSKRKTFPSDFSKNATYEALRICPRLKQDIDTAIQLYQDYPGRVHITRYETMAESPVETFRKLYKFLCLEFSQVIMNYIIKNTNGTANSGVYGVRRHDSKAASYTWRSTMGMSQALAFDEACWDVYDRFGYLPINNEEHLRDLDAPLKVDKEFIV